MSNSFKIADITRDPSGREEFNFWARYQGSNLIKFAEIDLPTWDMDTDPSIQLPINENSTNKVNPNAYVIGDLVIYDDSGNPHFSALVNNGIEDCFVTSDFTYVSISRVAGGAFDNASYSSPANSRGKFLLGYLT